MRPLALAAAVAALLGFAALGAVSGVAADRILRVPEPAPCVDPAPFTYSEPRGASAPLREEA